jgi:8-amino-7-oxononanoate synthase
MATVRAGSALDDSLAEDLATLDRAGLRRALFKFDQRSGAEVMVDGKPVIDFSSNDYLGLASDARIAHAAAEALRADATGGAAARLISGNHPLHEQLEQELAGFKGAEACLLFGSGYLANTGAIPALAGRRDAIYADELNHASIIDACRLSRAEVHIIPHQDVQALADALANTAHKYRRKLIVADGVFSMDGDLFPLKDVVPLARSYDAAIYIDDAHATGVLGQNGEGTAAHFGVDHDIDVKMGTLGKALGTVGAFVAGSSVLRDYLINRARTFIFTTATPPALAAASIAALKIAREEGWRRERLFNNARRLADGLRAIGRELPERAPGHIVPVAIGDAESTVVIGRALRADGFLVGAIRPPTVSLGSSRLRLTVSAAHTDDQIDRIIAALEQYLPSP